MPKSRSKLSSCEPVRLPSRDTAITSLRTTQRAGQQPGRVSANYSYPTLEARHKRRPRRQHKSEGPSAAVAPEEEAQHRSEGPQQQQDSRESQRTFRGPAERHSRRPLAQQPRHRGKGRAYLKKVPSTSSITSTGPAYTRPSTAARETAASAAGTLTEVRTSLGSSTRVKARQRQRHSSRKGAQHKSEGPLQQRYSWECLKAVGGPEKWHVGRHLKAISTNTSRLRLKRSTPQKVYSTGSFATTGPAPLRPSKAAREAEAQQRGAFTRTLAMMQRKGSAQIKTPSCRLKGEASLAPNKANED